MNTSVALVVDALKWAFKAFADNLGLYFRLLLAFTPILVISKIISMFVLLLLHHVGENQVLGLTVATSGFWLSTIPFYFTLCCIQAALHIYEGRTVTNIRECLVSWRQFVACFIALCLYILLSLLGFICFIIPGFIVMAYFYYIIYCIMSDNKGIIEAFRCSLRLTKTLPGHALLLLLCATMLGATWFLVPVAALMNVYAYKQRQNALTYDA